MCAINSIDVLICTVRFLQSMWTASMNHPLNYFSKMVSRFCSRRARTWAMPFPDIDSNVAVVGMKVINPLDTYQKYGTIVTAIWKPKRSLFTRPFLFQVIVSNIRPHTFPSYDLWPHTTHTAKHYRKALPQSTYTNHTLTEQYLTQSVLQFMAATQKKRKPRNRENK